MATAVQKITDTGRKIIVKMTGNLSSAAQETGVIKIDVSSLAGAMNANNMLMESNTHPKSTYRITPVRIHYNVGMAAGHVKLYFDSSDGTDDTIVLLRGSGTLEHPTLVIPTALTANSNGDIMLTTMGGVANDHYTILMECKKDPRDYLTSYPSANYTE